MKVLIVHNSYGRPSGEEMAVDHMGEMLRAQGCEVAFLRATTEFVRDKLWGKMQVFASGIWSPNGVRHMREALKRERPDVVNVHNLYPFISPAALFECRKAGIPVVMTVHNYRLLCPTGLFMRGDSPCERCLERGDEWACIRYKCERTWTKTIAYAMRNAVARRSGAYKLCVDKFACLTDFQRKKLIEGGFDEHKTVVIPNSIDTSNVSPQFTGNYVAYASRISREKGFELLLEVARRHPEIPFRFAGAAEDRIDATGLKNVSIEGYLEGEALHRFMKESRFIVIPSRCYEGFPMAVLESATYGKTVIAPDHGPFPYIIGHGNNAIGRLFTPGSSDSLEEAVTVLWQQPELYASLGREALEKIQQQYASEVVAAQWMKLLNDTINKDY